MKQFYQFFIICIISIVTLTPIYAQAPAKINTVEGSMWINPHLRSSDSGSEKVPLLIEKTTEDSYRLCSQIGEVKLFTMMAFEKNCESEEPCGVSFNENCEAICNSNCSYVSALLGEPENLPIATYFSPNFPNTTCFQRINNTHWYAYKALNFAQDVLNFNDIGVGNTQTVYARYSPIGHWGNSSADDFGVTMNGFVANSPDAICHEWGHYLNNRITNGNITNNNGNIEIQALDEGLGDIWSTLVRLYLEEGEDLERFQAALPDYRMWAVNRNFATTYKPYNTCAILDNDLPSNLQKQAWIGGDSHTKGLAISHWFYLLSEGTNGTTYNVTLKVPKNETTILTSNLCNNANFQTEEKTLQFNIEGIGHWKSLQILYKALAIIGEETNPSPLTFSKFRCATEQAIEALFPNDCHVLQQLSNAWYALNVGEKYDIAVPETFQFCEGESWAFSLQNDAMQSVELYAPDGELLKNGVNGINFEMENMTNNSTGTYQIKYRLADNCNGALNESCEWTKNIEVGVNENPATIAEIPVQTICEMEMINLDARDFMEADDYQWETSKDGIIGVGAELNFEAGESTMLRLIGTNDCGLKEMFTDIDVNLFPSVYAEIPAQTLCEKEMVYLDAHNFMEADAYQWHTSNGDIIGENAVLDFEATETTVLQLIGTNDCGTKELFTDIEVNKLPEISEILLQAEDCQSETVTLWVDGLYDNYTWNDGEGGENSLMVSEAGMYEVMVSNEEGCEVSMSIEVGEEAFADLSVDFEAGHTLVSDEVWTEQNLRIDGKLIVPSGRTLEIEGVEVEFLTETAGIVVEKGGVLKVNNAVLRGNKCEKRAWKGILAKGDAYKPQAQLQHHAQVFLTDATIRGAYMGVEMGEGYSSGFLATGGGILKATNTQFIDNSVGILFHAYMNESQSRIADNCSFVFENSFNSIHHLDELGYVGILAINIGGIEVKNSEFKNEQNVESIDIESNRGIGVLSWHAPMRIGTGDESEQNHFVKLYKGIDAYSTSTVLGFMLIEGNRFEEVTKGIHLQHNHFSSVVGNRFEKISGENSYGLYAQKAEGLTIANNVFEAASVATEAVPMWGAIVENSGYYGCMVYNNEFVKVGEEDKFFAAIQFEGDNNPNTLIDCNRFEPISRYDLLLLEDKNQHFSEEGGCDEFDPLISPLKNEWHTLCDNVETYNLYHDNTEAAINWTFVPGFAPNCYSNNFQPIVCDDDDNDCSLGGFGKLGGKDEDDILNNLETAISTQEHSLVVSQLVRYHLKTNELTTAIQTLEQDKQNIPTNTKTQVLDRKTTEEYQLPAFSIALVKKQIAPKKLQNEGEMSNDFLPKQTIVYTNSNNSPSIRMNNTDMVLENRHLKVKFNRIVNHFEGMNVAVIISDINGRVVHHEQIEGGHDEYLIDRELIANEKYVCSLWVNGTLVKSRKIVALN